MAINTQQQRWLWFFLGLGLLGFIGALIFLLSLYWQKDSGPAAVPISQGKVKIEVAEEGLYAITLTDLQALGADLKTWDSSQVNLTYNTEAVPYLIQEDKLIFYGQRSDNIYTETRPYILTLGEPGLLMENSTAVANQDSTATAVTSVWQPLQLEENKVYVSSARTDSNLDTWYWHTIHVDQTFDITLPLVNVTNDTAELTLNFWGASHDPNVDIDHDFELRLNEIPITTISWEGQTHYTAVVPLNPGILKSGTNLLTLDNSMSGATFVDIVQLNWLQLIYPTTPEAVNDYLEFVNTTGFVQLSGFSAHPIILNITEPAKPQQLASWGKDENTAALQVTADMHIIAAGPNALRQPLRITGLQPTNLTATNNQADLIILTTNNFVPAVQPLVQAREAQGLAVTVAPVAEVYDAFGSGQATPDAINQFLRYTHTRWQKPAPRYLLIVGDGTYDNRNYLGQRPQNNIPTYLVSVTHSGETVSDARLVDLDDDLRPDMAVGRWPVDSIEIVENIVQRTLSYEKTAAAKQTIFAADGTSSEFTTLADYLIEQSKLSDQSAVKLYGSTSEQVADSWNKGAWLITYVGHGSLNLWGKDSVFNSEAVNSLKNSALAPPIVLQFTCLTGFYAHPTDPSISEMLLINPNGPVLLIAATSLTLSAHQQPFAVNLLNNLQNPQFSRVGDALQQAKRDLDIDNFGLREISDTFGLIGDPSALIVRPQGG